MDAHACMLERWRSSRLTAKGKREFYALLRRHRLPYRTWNKKAQWLFQEVEKGEARLGEGPEGLVRVSRTLWAVISHMTLDGQVYFRYEKYRKFPNGKKQSRRRWTGPGENGLPVAISETFREGEERDELILRSLGPDEEAGFPAPALDRVSDLGMRLLEFHDSTAYKGIRSGEWGDTIHYLASAEEFDGGADFVSKDEHGVRTCQSWARKEDIPR